MAGSRVVRAVAVRTVAMDVEPVARKQIVQKVFEVLFGTRARFDQRDARGRVGDENVQEPTALTAAEAPDLIGDIDGAPLTGIDVQVERVHGSRLRGACLDDLAIRSDLF